MPAAQLHPNILGAIAALNDLRDQYRWLGDLLEPGTRDRRTRHLTPAARATLNRLHRAERADLTETQRQGLAPRGASAAPLVMNVLHAQLAAVDTVTAAAWIASSSLAYRPMLAYNTVRGTDSHRFTTAADYLTVALRIVDSDLAGVIGSDLHTAARLAGQVTGTEPQRHALTARCPACGGKYLVVCTYGTDDASVMCTRCRCHGIDCLCRRPQRTPGIRHFWPAAEFGQLDRLLARQAVAA